MLSLFQFCSSSSQKQLKSCKTLLLWKAESSQSVTEFCWIGVLLVGSGNPEVFCHIFFHTFVSVFCPPLTHAIIVPPSICIYGVHTGVYRWEENRFYSLCWNKHFEHLHTKLTKPDKRGNIQQILRMLNVELQDFIGKILIH